MPIFFRIVGKPLPRHGKHQDAAGQERLGVGRDAAGGQLEFEEVGRGAAGGFDEKAAAASAAGAQLVVIRRPSEQGETASEVLKRCKEMIR